MRVLKFSPNRRALSALRNRQEIVRAGLSRRDLMKLGLLTSAGYLVVKSGLSARADGQPQSPFTREFIEPLPTTLNGGMVVQLPVSTTGDVTRFTVGSPPSVAPNNAAGEGRTRAHQAFGRYPAKFPFPPHVLFQIKQQEAQISVSRDLPLQCMWGFEGRVPGPTYHARYGEQILVRNINGLPKAPFCGGFGWREVSTHLHNSHTPSESDGFPCDTFPNRDFPAAFYYDQHYPNVLAGFASTHSPDGNIKEAMSTLWYHDHTEGRTAQNVYKGLAGFYLLFNQFDTGNELTGFHLPGVPLDPGNLYSPIQFDIPLMLADKVFDPQTGELLFELFNSDGILGDKFLVNGKVQPFFDVQPRRYRFRVCNSGPSRFYSLFLTDRNSNPAIPFWHISNDGNLLPEPIAVRSITLGVAERMDIIIDFRPWAGRTLCLENRLEQTDGRGPTGRLLVPGQGNFILQFRVGKGAVADNSVDPATRPQFYALPAREGPRITRTFRFDRINGMWAINSRLFPGCGEPGRFRVKENTAEHWVFQNNSGGWQHPIHNHFEEFQIINRNGAVPVSGDVELARKDVVRLQFSERVPVFSRFRDFDGRYVMHCHNVIHEDHDMMLRWDIDPSGDSNTEP